MRTTTLSPRQQKFINEYLVDGNGAQAAIRAGYSVKSARAIAAENLTKPYIQAAVGTARRGLEAKFEINRERVVAELLEVVDLARSQGDPAAMIAAWREIAKMQGYYAPEVRKVDVNIAAKRIVEQLETLPDAELLRMVGVGEAFSANMAD